MFSAWECCPLPCVIAGRTKVLGASGFTVAAKHAHRAGDTANHTPRAEKSSKHPTWPPSNLSSTLSQCLHAHLTVSVSLSIFLIICHYLSLTTPSSFYLLVTVSLTISVSYCICIYLTLVLSLSPSSFTPLFYSPPYHHLSSCLLSLPFYYLSL